MSTKTKKQLEDEVVKLKAELKKSKSGTSKPTGPDRHIFRSTFKWLAFSLACAVLVVANLTFYTARTIVETDKFSAVATKIIEQPAVQSAIAEISTKAIYENVDVEGVFVEALPERAQPVAPFLASGIEKFTLDTTKSILANQSFQDGASQIITKAHSTLIQGIKQSNGDGSVNVNELYQAIGAQLQNTKLQPITNKQLPSKIGNIQVFESSWAPTVHRLVNDLNTIRLFTFIFVVILMAIFLWLSRNRRKALVQIGIGIFMIGLFTLLALRVAKSMVVAEAVNYPEAVGEIWDILISPLRIQTIGAMVGGLGLAFVAWIGGSTKSAKSTRSRVEAIFNGKVHSAIFKNENGLSRWTGQHKRLLQTAVGILFVLALLFINISWASVISVSLISLVLSFLVEAISEPTK